MTWKHIACQPMPGRNYAQFYPGNMTFWPDSLFHYNLLHSPHWGREFICCMSKWSSMGLIWPTDFLQSVLLGGWHSLSGSGVFIPTMLIQGECHLPSKLASTLSVYKLGKAFYFWYEFLNFNRLISELKRSQWRGVGGLVESKRNDILKKQHPTGCQ